MRTLCILAALLTMGAAATPAQQTAAGVITVLVRRGDTAETLSGVDVTLRSRIVGQEIPAPLLSRTGASGMAVFRNVAPGTYSVSAARDSFFGPSPEMDGAARSSAASVVLDGLRLDAFVELYLFPGSVISGRVTGADGAPLPQLSVTLDRLDQRGGVPTRMLALSSSARIRTDERGEYRAFWLPPGEYYVSVNIPRDAAVLASLAGETYPLEAYYPGVTDIRRALLVRVGTGEERSGIDIQVPVLPGVRISGTVRNLAPAPSAADGATSRTISAIVLATRENTSPSTALVYTTEFRASPGNPDETIFELSGVPPGSYDLLSIFRTADWPAFGNTAIEVGGDDLTDVVAVVRKAPDITVRVTLEDPPDGFTWNNLRPMLQPVRTLPIPEGSARFPTNSNTAAENSTVREFLFLNLLDRTYRIVAQGLPQDAYVGEILGSGRSLSDSGAFVMDYGAPADIRMIVRFDGCRLDGVVVDETGVPAANTIVTLVPDRPQRGNLNLYRRATAGRDGAYRLHGIAPGRYTLFAWEALPLGNPEQDEAFLLRYETLGQPVSIMNCPAAAAVAARPIPASAVQDAAPVRAR